jgi:serine/threonine protein kinase
MDELYQTVKKGAFNSIPDCFSIGLEKVISAMLQVNPENRPTCQQMLNTSLFKKWMKRISSDDFLSKDAIQVLNINKTTTTIYETQNQLIKTIKMSEDLRILETYLPAPSYEDPVIKLNLRKADHFTEKFGRLFLTIILTLLSEE